MPSTFVYSCTSNLPLAKTLAAKLRLTLAKTHFARFSNDETRVWVQETKVPTRAIIVQSLSRPADEHIVQFTLLADAVRRLGATDITAVIPWLAYSKQDKVFRQGEPLSVKVIAKILQVAPLTRIITFDLHNLAILGFFDIPVVNLSARLLFVKYFMAKPLVDTIVVAPDEGAVKTSTSFASALGVSIAYVDKLRDLVTGRVSIAGLSRPVRGKNILIIDDVIVTGATIIEVSKFLKKRGAASIRVAATHHLYVPGTQAALEKSAIDEIVVTDTVAAPPGKFRKLHILSVADLLVQELR